MVVSRNILRLVAVCLIFITGSGRLIAQAEPQYISYLTGRERQTRFNLMNLNTGEIRQIPVKVEPINTYDWSPDGQKIALDNGKDIYIVNTEGAVVQTLMNGSKTIRYNNPLWSPDGTQIALFEVTGDGNRLVLVNVETGDVRSVLRRDDTMYGMVWSLDGQYIAMSSSVSTPVKSFVINVPACLESPETCYESSILLSGLVSDWSPDSRSLLMENGEFSLQLFVDEIQPKLSDPECQQNYLYLCLSGDSRPLVLKSPSTTPTSETSAFSGQNEEDGRWSADGSQIVFMTYEFTFGGRDLYLVDADGSHLRRLTDDYEEQRLPRWRPA